MLKRRNHEGRPPHSQSQEVQALTSKRWAVARQRAPRGERGAVLEAELEPLHHHQLRGKATRERLAKAWPPSEREGEGGGGRCTAASPAGTGCGVAPLCGGNGNV